MTGRGESGGDMAVKQGNRRTIGRGMMYAGISFTAAMCLFFAIEMTMLIKGSMYSSFDAHMKDVLTHIEHTTDMEDLQECIRTGVPSEEYNALQQRVNDMVDEFELLYIYIGIPQRTETGKGIFVNVVASTSDAERAAGDTEEFPIGYYDENFYTEEQIIPYFDAWEHPDRYSTFSEKEGAFESVYIVTKPLLDANGNVYALLCADMSLDMMHRNVNYYIWISVALILAICILFSISIGTWLGRYVSRPLAALEKSARDFAEKSSKKPDLSQLTYEPPRIHTENEIQSLSGAITQMAEGMRGYVEDILNAEKHAEAAEEEVVDITRTAYEDGLTQVKSKTAYDAKKAELMQKIADGTAKFALTLIDVNNLKRINDTYGLERGDRYIIRASEVMSDVYQDIPIYRVEGDEFAVVLEDEAYRNRDELFELLEEKFLESQTDMKRELWERCSAAAGMTEFSPDSDTHVDQVYRRAEKIMLRNKRLMKNDIQ